VSKGTGRTVTSTCDLISLSQGRSFTALMTEVTRPPWLLDLQNAVPTVGDSLSLAEFTLGDRVGLITASAYWWLLVHDPTARFVEVWSELPQHPQGLAFLREPNGEVLNRLTAGNCAPLHFLAENKICRTDTILKVARLTPYLLT
jgi:hypothetical protein